MDYPELLRKKALFEQAKDTLPEITVKSYVQAFELEYTHNSTAIEGQHVNPFGNQGGFGGRAVCRRQEAAGNLRGH